MKNTELDKYKEFFIETEKIIQGEHTVEDKLMTILYNIETMIRSIRGASNINIYNFVRTVYESIKPNIVEPVKTCRCKESEEYEIPGFESKQEKSTYNVIPSKPHSFPCQSCTKVDKECIPTDFEGGGCGECPKYEDRVWAKILNDKNQIKDRYLTNKELSMWLSKGNGLLMDKGTGRKSASYDYWEEDKIVDYMNLAIRKWEDNEWHEPTYSYCFGDK